MLDKDNYIIIPYTPKNLTDLHEHAHDVHPASPSGQVQRGTSVDVGGVQIRSVVQQQGYAISVVCDAGRVKGGAGLGVGFSIHIGTVTTKREWGG